MPRWRLRADLRLRLRRLRQRLHGAHELARRLLGPQDDGHAVIRLGDQLQRVAQRPVQRRGVHAQHVAQSILPVHANERRRLRVELAAHEREVHGAIDVVLEADQPERAELRLDLRFADDLDGFLHPQPILDEIGDRADLQLVAPRELDEIVAARHRAVVVQDLDDDGRRLEAREPREVATRFRVPRARQHAAGLRHQREDVAGLAQVARLRLRRDGGLDRARAVVRRDARRHAFGGFDRDREIRGLPNVGIADHQRQPQLLAARARQRQADQPAPVLRHEVDVFGAHFRGRHDRGRLRSRAPRRRESRPSRRRESPRRFLRSCSFETRRYRWSRAYPCFLRKARSMAAVCVGLDRGVRDNARACRPQY